MNYETEIIDGHKAVIRRIFKPHEIEVGSRWCAADGSNHIVTVEDIITYGSRYEIVYSWEKEGQKDINEKDQFDFQCHYCLLID